MKDFKTKDFISKDLVLKDFESKDFEPKDFDMKDFDMKDFTSKYFKPKTRFVKISHSITPKYFKFSQPFHEPFSKLKSLISKNF